MVGFSHERRSLHAAHVEQTIKVLLCDRAFAEFSFPLSVQRQQPEFLVGLPSRKQCRTQPLIAPQCTWDLREHSASGTPQRTGADPASAGGQFVCSSAGPLPGLTARTLWRVRSMEHRQAGNSQPLCSSTIRRRNE